ncbi:MAG TPA: CDGSH iron-sulfur domain-containing protein [Thermoplasmata archaeon]|nr:CDGSH iron-sulfur domain-containing protein [Thermoplasmata archaeon]
MTRETRPKIVVTTNGPYHLVGAVPLAVQTIVPNRERMSWDWAEGRAFPTEPDGADLCRCGHSAHKPFCDGTHEKIGFDGTETASREPYDRQAETISGPTMTLQDQESLCAFARFCDPGGKIWALIEQTDSEPARELVAREGMHCPSGRLVVHDRRTGATLEPELPRSIGLVEDPALHVSGPLWVRGGIRIESADGRAYEIRHRVTLCRCGASSNKPFCDGSHASIKFHDGIGAP